MIVSMIVPVYKHTWQGWCTCVKIQPRQLQLANRLPAACYVQQLAAQARPQMFHISYKMSNSGAATSESAHFLLLSILLRLMNSGIVRLFYRPAMAAPRRGLGGGGVVALLPLYYSVHTCTCRIIIAVTQLGI